MLAPSWIGTVIVAANACWIKSQDRAKHWGHRAADEKSQRALPASWAKIGFLQ